MRAARCRGLDLAGQKDRDRREDQHDADHRKGVAEAQHPQFEVLEVRRTVGRGKTAEWHECKLQPKFCYEHHGATETLDWNKSLSSWLGLKKSGGSHGSNNAGSRGSNNALREMRKTNGPGSHLLRSH